MDTTQSVYVRQALTYTISENLGLEFPAVAYGSLIKEAREQRGWTQAELAERIRASAAKVSRWENNSRHKPSIDDINALISLLPLSADTLIQELGLHLNPPAASRLPRELIADLLELPPDGLATVQRIARALRRDQDGTDG